MCYLEFMMKQQSKINQINKMISLRISYSSPNLHIVTQMRNQITFSLSLRTAAHSTNNLPHLSYNEFITAAVAQGIFLLHLILYAINLRI